MSAGLSATAFFSPPPVSGAVKPGTAAPVSGQGGVLPSSGEGAERPQNPFAALLASLDGLAGQAAGEKPALAELPAENGPQALLAYLASLYNTGASPAALPEISALAELTGDKSADPQALVTALQALADLLGITVTPKPGADPAAALLAGITQALSQGRVTPPAPNQAGAFADVLNQLADLAARLVISDKAAAQAFSASAAKGAQIASEPELPQNTPAAANATPPVAPPAVPALGAQATALLRLLQQIGGGSIVAEAAPATEETPTQLVLPRALSTLAGQVPVQAPGIQAPKVAGVGTPAAGQTDGTPDTAEGEDAATLTKQQPGAVTEATPRERSATQPVEQATFKPAARAAIALALAVAAQSGQASGGVDMLGTATGPANGLGDMLSGRIDMPGGTAAQQAIAADGMVHARAGATATGAAISIAAVAGEIATRFRNGTMRFEMRLDPPELGRIDVRLEVDKGGNVTTRLMVEKSETLDMLRADARTLERALEQSGLKLGDHALSFSLKDGRGWNGEGRGGDDAPRRALSIGLEEEGETTIAASGRSGRGGTGLDLRI